MPVRAFTSSSSGSIRFCSLCRCSARRVRCSRMISTRRPSITGNNTDACALQTRRRISYGGSSSDASTAWRVPVADAVPNSHLTGVSTVHPLSRATDRNMQHGSSITSCSSSSNRSASSRSQAATRATVVASNERIVSTRLHSPKRSYARKSTSISSTTPHQSCVVNVTSLSGGSAGGTPSRTATNSVRSNSLTLRLACA